MPVIRYTLCSKDSLFNILKIAVIKYKAVLKTNICIYIIFYTEINIFCVEIKYGWYATWIKYDSVF